MTFAIFCSEDEEVGDTEVAYWTIREHDSKF